MNAHEWGLAHGSCPEALKWRASLGPEATQADAWRACRDGGWMIRQLEHGLGPVELEAVCPALRRAPDRIVTWAIRRGIESLRGVRAPWATGWRRWAREWLAGRDRSGVAAAEAARAAEAATVEAEAEAAETGSATRTEAWGYGDLGDPQPRWWSDLLALLERQGARVVGTVAFGDCDAADTYHELARRAPLVWLDSYCKNDGVKPRRAAPCSVSALAYVTGVGDAQTATEALQEIR